VIDLSETESERLVDAWLDNIMAAEGSAIELELCQAATDARLKVVARLRALEAIEKAAREVSAWCTIKGVDGGCQRAQALEEALADILGDA
jgi:hypothetical protein